MDAFVEVLLEQVRSIDLEPLPKATKLLSKLKSLEETVSTILPALPSAVRLINEEEAAKQLMNEVNDLANQLEKLLKKLQSEALLARVRLSGGSFSSMLVGCFNPSFFTCRHLVKKLANITLEFRRLEPVAAPFSASAGQPADDQAAVYGREEDLKNILDSLVSDGGGEAVAVVPIHGAPGIGKTTLARQAYNRAKLGFDLAVWVLVSDKFDAVRVTQDVLKELEVEIPSSRDLLQQKLEECVSDKRFLLVLDQVQAEVDGAAWSAFMDPLASAAAPGSRVLITMTTTTMTDGVPLLKGSVEAYEVKKLRDEDCWSLLASVAFPGKDPNEYSHLKSVGMEIVGKCEGHPRPTTVMGRMLRDIMDKSVWEKTLKSGPWESGDAISSLENVFVSYDALPPRIKRCFAYCSIFPKDMKLLKETLILFWIAEDFLPQHHGTATPLETIAHQYFHHLTNSFLLNSDQDKGVSMPPQVSNVAQVVLGHVYHHGTSDSKTSPDIIRYVSCTHDVSINIDGLYRYKNLRTLLLVSSPQTTRAIYTAQVLPHDLFSHFPELRTLSLSGLPMQNLPASIGDLKLLQFLDISHTLIEKLPDTTATLSNLLALKLNNCVYMVELPSVENLTKLRHLDISQCKKIKAMPRGIAGLLDLRYLSDFIVRDQDESLLRELRDLVHLSGKLTISGLQYVLDPSDAREANLASKKDVRELVLEWTATFTAVRNKNVETEVLDYLKPCSNLEILSIVCYGGTRFPDWISLLRELVHLTLSNCRRCHSLPLLGQLPKIKTLSIEGIDQVVSIGTEFCGDGSPFPSLETLEFRDMRSWEEWSVGSVEGLPRLKFLTIERCPKLKEFKVLMTALEQLTISECQELAGFSVQEFPSLLELDILHCSKLKEMPHSFPILRKLRIWECHELISFSNINTTSPTGEEFPRLLELDIQKCTRLKELPQKFSSLKKLRIRSCKQLSKLSTFPTLDDLVLEECDELALGDEVQGTSLVSMVICQLPKFEYPRSQLLHRLSSLINLEISNCANLVALTEKDENGSQAISSLERLVIDGCPKLRQLPDIISCFSSLKELIIMGCEGLEFFPEMALPPVFKRLVVSRCKHLKSLPPNIFDSQTMGLEFLDIHGCPSIASISECNEIPESLRLLSLTDCTNLKSLPAGLNRENTSLTTLRIGDCHSLENFPHQGLPCNISSLYVINCGKLRPLSTWGLEELDCLRTFTFGGCPEMVNFEGTTLPDSVGFLVLKGLPKLSSLTGLLQNLNSLDILTIRDCPRLEILAEEKLPESLSCLYVSNCSILVQRCKRREGQDWSKIKHIPLIEFDFIQTVKEQESLPSSPGGFFSSESEELVEIPRLRLLFNEDDDDEEDGDYDDEHGGGGDDDDDDYDEDEDEDEDGCDDDDDDDDAEDEDGGVDDDDAAEDEDGGVDDDAEDEDGGVDDDDDEDAQLS